MKELQSISVVAPGFAGINTQDSSVSLPTTFALVADNCIIDRFGRLGSRQGWTNQTTDGATELEGRYIEFIHEHTNADKTLTMLSGGNQKLFKGGVGGTALTDITPAAYGIALNNWKAATLNDVALIVQEGQEPIVYSEGNTPATQPFTTLLSGNPSFGTNYPNDVLAAFGRFWVHDGKNIYWSTDIADSNFPRFNGGSSGFLNIASVLPKNVDTIVALASHNNFLIIFCENNIVIYNNADNVVGTDFAVQDVIAGVGCVARDSVQPTGGDLIFLSHSGVRSLGRVIQEKSMPLRDLTVNIKDQVDRYLDREPNKNGICSVYSEDNAFYLLSFPASKTVLCLDMRKALEDGAARVTLWVQHEMRALHRCNSTCVFIGKPDGIGLYEGYRDNEQSYRMTFRSSYMDLQNSTQTKVMKKVNVVVFGGRGQEFIIKTGVDYKGVQFSYPFVIDTGLLWEWGGTAEWNIFEWSAQADVEKINTPVNGAGKALQIGFDTVVDGVEVSVQRLDLFVKTGRIN